MRSPAAAASPLARLVRPLWRAMVDNAKPALALQGSIALVVMAYAWWPTAHAALTAVAGWKQAFGYAFTATATAFFAAVLPALVRRAGGVRIEPRGFAFLTAFWLWKGVEIDAFYRLQGLVFGEGSGIATVVAKVAVDQLLYAPLLASPSLAIGYAFAEARCDARATRARLGRSWYRDRVVTVQVSSWIVWVPTVSIIYALPSALQMPVADLMMCLWSLILTYLAREAAPTPTGSEAAPLRAAA